jgi:hypothetical protein
MPRPTILTQAALARVASLVGQGRSAVEIANEMGCTLGTLRVRCSQRRISLRRPLESHREKTLTATNLVPSGQANAVCKSDDHSYAASGSRSPSGESSDEGSTELKLLLPQITTKQLQQRGALQGASGSTLAAELLVRIVRDGLYDALLDGQ